MRGRRESVVVEQWVLTVVYPQGLRRVWINNDVLADGLGFKILKNPILVNRTGGRQLRLYTKLKKRNVGIDCSDASAQCPQKLFNTSL